MWDRPGPSQRAAYYNCARRKGKEHTERADKRRKKETQKTKEERRKGMEERK